MFFPLRETNEELWQNALTGDTNIKVSFLLFYKTYLRGDIYKFRQAVINTGCVYLSNRCHKNANTLNRRLQMCSVK